MNSCSKDQKKDFLSYASLAVRFHHEEKTSIKFSTMTVPEIEEYISDKQVTINLALLKEIEHLRYSDKALDENTKSEIEYKVRQEVSN